MAKIATIAAAMALMIGQPVTSAWAQSSDVSRVDTTSERGNGGIANYLRGHPDRILLALGALTAVILGLASISGGKGGNGNGGPRPTSP